MTSNFSAINQQEYKKEGRDIQAEGKVLINSRITGVKKQLYASQKKSLLMETRPDYKSYKNIHPKYDLNCDYITTRHCCLQKSYFKIIYANVHSLTNSFNPEGKKKFFYTDIISFMKWSS